MERIFKGRVVVPGEVTLKALVSHGGFNTLASFKDCKEGKNTCTDQNNPDLYGKSTVGVALCLPQTIGSTTGGMVLYNSAVIGCNPGALLFSNTIDSLAAPSPLKILANAVENRIVGAPMEMISRYFLAKPMVFSLAPISLKITSIPSTEKIATITPSPSAP